MLGDLLFQHFLVYIIKVTGNFVILILLMGRGMNTDTIAAIATAPGNAGIGIIRVSGEDAIKIVDVIFRNKNNMRVLKDYKSHTIHYGFIFNGDEMIDEVMVSILKKPGSFTAEDTVEINCHGGMFVLGRILSLVTGHGARLAQPGEFTKRAFLNGRIDLSEAEAVMDIISSQNELALKNSLRQLRGAVSEKIGRLRKGIVYEIAYIESALDDPEHISLAGYPEKLEKRVDEFIRETESLLATADNGRILKEGIKTVIVGKPNAGKSSLLNVLAGEERAIVTDIAGTTRDVLEENINLGGISLLVIDTAGIRSTEDVVERIGVERAKKSLQEADLVVYMVDSTVALDGNDYEIMEMMKDKKCIVLYNKSDLVPVVSLEEVKGRLEKEALVIRTSVKDNTGIGEFEQAVKKLFLEGKISVDGEIMITSLRHKEALKEALESLKQVKRSLTDSLPEDFYAIDLMGAYASLGKITGEEIGEDLVNEIFSKFCMGK